MEPQKKPDLWDWFNQHQTAFQLILNFMMFALTLFAGIVIGLIIKLL